MLSILNRLKTAGMRGGPEPQLMFWAAGTVPVTTRAAGPWRLISGSESFKLSLFKFESDSDWRWAAGDPSRFDSESWPRMPGLPGVSSERSAAHAPAGR